LSSTAPAVPDPLRDKPDYHATTLYSVSSLFEDEIRNRSFTASLRFCLHPCGRLNRRVTKEKLNLFKFPTGLGESAANMPHAAWEDTKSKCNEFGFSSTSIARNRMCLLAGTVPQALSSRAFSWAEC
jgi:hypothetical protein